MPEVVCRWGVAAAGMLCSALTLTAWSATLSSESSVGISSEYASNPFYLQSGAQAAGALGVLANLPATYTGDTLTVDLIPRVRFAETSGPIALLSNYQYLDTDWRWNTERNTLTVNADWHHDSTYYNQFENAALLGHDLRRLELIGNLAWQFQLTERSDVQLLGSYDKVNYSQKGAPSSLTDYTYYQGAAQYDYALSERWQSTTSAGYGHYQLPLGSYMSDQRFAQTGLKHGLSEQWSLSAQVGYAYLSAHAVTEICCQIAVSPSGQLYLVEIPVTQTASRGAPNYTASLERKTERLVLDFAASRAIEPSGLGVLVTQDDVSASVTRQSTERLSLGATVHWSRISDSLGRLSYLNRHYYDGDLTANWQWTGHWTLQLQASYTEQFLSPQLPGAPCVTVYLNLLRQFGRLRL
jgi:hypothetical protein